MRQILACTALLTVSHVSSANAALTRQWGTYFGGPHIDRSMPHSSAIAPSGAIVIGGQTFSTSGLVSVDAQDAGFDGEMDGFVATFSTSGKRMWSTYVGGDGIDVVDDIAVDKAGNLYVVGVTSSSDMATPGAFDMELDGLMDAFIAKFDGDGSLIWCTLYGGEDLEADVAVALDHAGGIYITGATRSMDGMATPGAHDVDFNGGEYDVFLARFTADGDRVWGSYYGGEDDDGEDDQSFASDSAPDIAALSTVRLDGSVVKRTLVVTGITYSSHGIATPNTHDSIRNGVRDAFLATFDGETGELMWGSYVGGDGNEYAGGLAVHPGGDIYLVGATSSKQDIATNGAFKTSISGDVDAFISKFNANGQLTWSTYFGGPDSPNIGQESAQSVALDAKGQVYVAGMTTSDANIAFNSKWAYDLSYNPGPWNEFDLFLAKFDSSGKLLGSTYYGGPDREWMATVLVSQSISGKAVYLTGTTISKDSIATPGSFSASVQDEDAFIARFSDNDVVIKPKF
jgi:hypothetical protein